MNQSETDLGIVNESQLLGFGINLAISEGLQSAEVRSSLEAVGVEARIGTAGEFAAALVEQAREWKAVIDETGIKIE
jgi:tripartite-type tricarboxylate transporter receptor subunit TctC